MPCSGKIHMESRLVELELRYMEMKRTVEHLSEMVHSHERSILQLTAQLASATKRLRDLGEQTGTPIGDEPPPHY